MFAGVAQSVVQLIRNQQVVCSSHITSSTKNPDAIASGFFIVKRKPPAVLVVPKSFSFAQFPLRRQAPPCARGAVSEAD